jgi:hypothetical protein
MKKFSCQTQKMIGLKPMALLFFIILIFYFYAAAAETIFSDNFSGSYPGDWYIGNDSGGENDSWTWPNAYAQCYSHSPRGENNHPHNVHVYMERRNIDLSGYTSAILYFDYKANTKTKCGIFTVNIRDQKSSWHRMFSTGRQGASWKAMSIDLDQFAGQSGLYLQFRFDFDGNNSPPGVEGSYTGAYVDNVVLTAEGTPSPSTKVIPPPANIPVIQDKVPVIHDKETAISGISGDYSVSGLFTGNYKVQYNTTGNFIGEWYNNKASFFSANVVPVSDSQTTTLANAVLTGGGSISGQVTDTSGNSINSAWVRVYDLNYYYVSGTATNSSGNYTVNAIPAGNYKVHFDVSVNYIGEWYDDKSSFYTADQVSVLTGQDTPGIDAQLSKGASISGRVTDGTNGIADVYVVLYDPNYSYVSYDYTDFNGDYQIPGLLPGSYKVKFYTTGDFVGEWYNDKSDFYSADPVTVASGEAIELEDAVLALGGYITGQVINTSGGSIYPVWVKVYNLDYAYLNGASTSSSGYYTVSGIPAGNYKVEFDPSFNYIGEWYDDKHFFDTADRVVVTGGVTTSGINAVLAHGGRISGRITDAYGRGGIAGVQVLVYDMDNGSIGSTFTDGNGNYTLLDIPDGICKVRFYSTGNYISEYYNDKKNFDEADPIFIPDGQTITGIDAVLEPGGIITGNVTDTTGNPLAYLDVEVYDLDGNSLARVSTGQDGYYEIRGVPRGACKILFDPCFLNGYRGQNLIPEWYNNTGNFNEAETISVKASQVIQGIDAVMEEGGSISGRITDESGNGIESVTILVVENNTHDAIYFYTDDSGYDGTYQVKGLYTGNYLVIFQGGKGFAGEFYNDALFESAATLVPVVTGSETGDIDAVLTKAGTVSGWVTDTNGNGIENVTVRLYDSANNKYLAWLNNIDHTDSNGYYSIPTAIPGERKIMFDTGEVTGGNFVSEYYNNKQDINGADIITLQPAETLVDINAVLSTGGGTLSGYVTNLNGIALEGVEVEIYNAQNQSYMAACDTNSSGYFAARGLVPGQYKVFLSHSNIYPTQWYSDESTFADADEVTVTNNENTQIRVILGEGGTIPALEIIYPNGGEILTAGSICEITWQGTGEGNAVLEYSIDGGDSWTTIAGSTPNDGNYDWLVPNTPSENCLVRIRESEGDESSSDTSDNVFTIVLPPHSTLTVTSPNGGERLTGGSTYNITWTGSTGVENVSIEYSPDRGKTWQSVVPVTVNDGNYSWTVPDTPTNNCLVRIIAGDTDEAPTDVSDAEFSIVSPSSAIIMVTSPNGGEQLVVGNIYNITWTCSGPPGINHVKIEYSTNNGNTWAVLTGSTVNSGSYPWTVIDNLSDNCLIRVSGLERNASDTSDSVFSIIPFPTITITSPNGGENWNVGTTHCITWNSTGSIKPVKIEYSIDNGDSWRVIENFVVNSGSFNWKVPGPPSHDCWVRISEANTDRVISDTSDAVFSIPPAPIITVTSPNGRERLIAGTSHEITWTSSQVIGNVIIEYSINNGDSWITIQQSTANDGSHNWTVPATPSGYCLVRIGQCEPGGPADVSDNLFSIIPDAAITVTSPNGGENLTVGAVHAITWTSMGMSGEDTVIIGYSTDNGGSWKTIAPAAVNNGSYNWTVPDTLSDNCLMRISGSDGDIGPADVSDGVFSIVPSPGFRVISPNGGERLTVDTLYDITWSFSQVEEESVIIEYSIDNGATWSMIGSASADSGSYSWTVPDDPSENCLVRIRAGDADDAPTDVSDSVFSIVPGIGLIVTSPNGGEQLQTGSIYNITWTNEGVEGDINIDLYRGKSFDYNISKVPVESGKYEWNIPGNFAVGDDYKVLIFKDTTEDYSDTSFSITEQGPNHPDFNNDGKVDILWRNYEYGFNEVWYMDGAKFLGSMMLPAQPEPEWRIVGTGDFNRDGKIDILWRRYTDGRNMVWYMNGTTLTGQEPLLTRSDTNWKIAGTGDFNRDGSTDVLWRNTSNGENQVWYLKGVSKIGEGSLAPLEDQSWRIAGTGDFNGDGKVDILWRNYETGKNEVWNMDGVLRIGSLALVQLPGTDWQIVGTGDFNCDGATDILWRRYSDGKNMIWTMDGVSRTGYEYIVTRPDLNWRVAGNGDYYQKDESQNSNSSRD